jgi:ATP-dependent exoDNAse (exonuclease V) beta subunit
MRRPRSGTASSESHAARRDAAAEAGFEPQADLAERAGTRTAARNQLGRIGAMAVGTAVHELLENWDPGAPPDEELERQRARLPGVLDALGVDDAAGALAEALTILDGFAASELFDHFTSLGERIVARELPVWLAVDPTDSTSAAGVQADGDDTPLECIAGSIDLVYRDPDGGLVVVDYKSDRITSAQERAARVQQYSSQGQSYVCALTQGLSLAAPPRFELWFLRDGTLSTPLDER